MRFLDSNHLWRRLKSHKRTKRRAAYKANERILEEVEGRIQSAVDDLETRQAVQCLSILIHDAATVLKKHLRQLRHLKTIMRFWTLKFFVFRPEKSP